MIVMYSCIQRGDGLAISLDHVKSHLRLESSSEDAFLEKLIRSASESVENYLRRSLLLKTWRTIYQGKESQTLCEINLCYPPIFAISSVSELLYDGTKRELKRYILTPHEHMPKLSVYGKNIEVIYKCGYGENYLSVPEPIGQAITLLVGEMFEKRIECVDVISQAISFLLQPYRVMSCL
jgi:uncharacterized phiE125 gp8 family phage protein